MQIVGPLNPNPVDAELRLPCGGTDAETILSLRSNIFANAEIGRPAHDPGIDEAKIVMTRSTFSVGLRWLRRRPERIAAACKM